MTDFEDNLARAGSALSDLAAGPGQEAANAIGQAFEGAGSQIEQALANAARSGELEFSRMAEAMLRDLARVAAEAIFAGERVQAFSGASRNLTMNLNVGAGADAQGIVTSRGAIAAALARAAASGGRFL